MIILSIFLILGGLGLIFYTIRQKINWDSAQPHEIKGWLWGIGGIITGIRILLDVLFGI